MTDTTSPQLTTYAPTSRSGRGGKGRVPLVQMQFAAIWIALAVLLILGALFLPRSISATSIISILPFAGFLAIAAMGQSLVLMARGIDLSVPAIVTLSSTVLLGTSGGAEGSILVGTMMALLAAVCVGVLNGVLVAWLKLNALIVTLSTGAIIAGVTLWYRTGLPAESGVPTALAEFGGARWLGLNTTVWIAIVLTLALTVVLRRTQLGRRFEAVGANPRAAYATGVEIRRYQAGAFIAASLLYGIVGVLLSAFIRNPTLDVGNPYLLAPIAAAVLGGTAISGGIGSMIAVGGAALFLTQLGQTLKVLGLETSWQMIFQGVAIALGMFLSEMQGRKRRGG
ncbi:ABC transporter permease [uncultured Maritimibacter sp.]|uniref:ABC transporter permease n=1 Tax=uncultured Maritimibacter sp. TaxID=991866 RepID=UPI000A6DA41B|nr:ABC transporter permease [uncultured Maritimibacter sp.]